VRHSLDHQQPPLVPPERANAPTPAAAAPAPPEADARQRRPETLGAAACGLEPAARLGAHRPQEEARPAQEAVRQQQRGPPHPGHQPPRPRAGGRARPRVRLAPGPWLVGGVDPQLAAAPGAHGDAHGLWTAPRQDRQGLQQLQDLGCRLAGLEGLQRNATEESEG